MYKRLKILPIPNDDTIASKALGNDDDLYWIVYCAKDIDSTQVSSCRKCDDCCGIGKKEVLCGREN